jgi:putative transposase
VKANQAVYPVATMCRLLGVSPSGYYAWRDRAPSARAQQDQVLQERIRQYHEASRGRYGAPRIHADLAEEGIRVGRKQVARLMRAGGLRGVSRRKSVRTTIRKHSTTPAPDLVDRNFSASGPNQLWVADITYVPTSSGWLYLAVVLDAWSRRVVGWAMKTTLRTELVVEALDMAVSQRRPRGGIRHSDHGSQYTSIAFGKRCRAAGVQPSMGSVGDCYDNALCESFFATYECELLGKGKPRTPAEARMVTFEFIESWYNHRRRHSALGYRSPARFEAEELREEPEPAPRARRFRRTLALESVPDSSSLETPNHP